MNSVWIYHAGEQESFFSFSKLWTQIEPQWGDGVQQDKRTTHCKDVITMERVSNLSLLSDVLIRSLGHHICK